MLVPPAAGATEAPSARVAKAPTKADAQRFIGKLERAFRGADAAFLLGHLDPAVIIRYGTDACRAYTAPLNDPTRRLHVKQVTGPSDFVYTSDGLSTTVHKVFTVVVDQVAYAKKAVVGVHVTAQTWFSDCGTALPASSAGSSSNVLALLAGHFTGPWHNLTFGSTGTVDMTIKLDKKRGRLSMATTLTGKVFGAPAPKPESFKAKLDLANPTKPVTVTSKTFGAVTTELHADGSFTQNAPNVPGSRVNTFKLVGRLTPAGLVATYIVGLADGTQANGTITMTKAP